MNIQIRTLEELQAEKKKLKMQAEVSKREFIHSFGTTKSQAKDFLLKKVALPAGALGLATYSINKMSSSSSEDVNKEVVVKSNTNFFLKLMPIALPLLRTFLSSTNVKLELPSFLEKVIAPKEKELVEQ